MRIDGDHVGADDLPAELLQRRHREFCSANLTADEYRGNSIGRATDFGSLRQSLCAAAGSAPSNSELATRSGPISAATRMAGRNNHRSLSADGV